MNRRTLLKTAISGALLPIIPSWAIAQSSRVSSAPKPLNLDWKPFVLYKGPAYHSVSLIVRAPDSMRWVAHTVQSVSTTGIQGPRAIIDLLDYSSLPVKKNPTRWDMTQAWRPGEDFASKEEDHILSPEHEAFMKNLWDESFPLPIHKDYFVIGPEIRWIDAFDLVTQPSITIREQLPKIGMNILLKYHTPFRGDEYRPVQVVDPKTLPKGMDNCLIGIRNLVKQGYDFPEGISERHESLLEWIELPPLPNFKGKETWTI